MTCAKPSAEVVVPQVRCRGCGRTHEHVLTAAEEMRAAGIRTLFAGILRTRWRVTLDDEVDWICWFCQLWLHRYVEAIADAGGPAALRRLVGEAAGLCA